MTAASFLARVVTGSTPTSTGVQSYTSAGLGTPKGGHIMGGFATTLATVTNNCCATNGYFDGTNQRYTVHVDGHGQATQFGKSSGGTTRIFELRNADGVVVVRGEFSQWVTDGVEINWTTVDASNSYQFAIVLFSGTLCECHAFHATGTATPTTVTTNFDTDFVLTDYMASAAGELIGEMRYNPGIAARAAANASAGLYSDDGVGTMDSIRRSSTNDLGQSVRIQSGPDLFGADVLIENYTSTGFDVAGDLGGTPTNGPRICGLAVKTGAAAGDGDGADVHIDVDDPTPSSTQTENKTAPGHRSGFVYMPYSAATGTNAYQNSGAAGCGVDDLHGGRRAFSFMVRRNVGTADTASWISDKTVDLWNHTQASHLLEGTIVDQANGFDLTWTLTNNNRRIKYISVEEKPQRVTPTGIPSAEAFGTPTLNQGGGLQTITATGIPSAEAFGTPALQATVDVSPTAIPSDEAFGTPAVQPGLVQVSPTGIASAEAFGTPTLQATIDVLPGGIASAEAFGAATVQPGLVQVSPTGIASAEAFGTPALAATVDVSPTAIPSEEAFGAPQLVPGVATVSPTAIPSAEAFGSHTLLATVDVAPTAIPSAEAFGTPALAQVQTISPTGIASAEAFGTPSVEPQVATVSPTGIASGEAFGAALVQPGLVQVAPTGIPSAEAFGTPQLVPGVAQVSPTGIPSAEAFGTPTVQATVDVSPTAIPSEEAFGTPVVNLAGAVTILPTGIPSAEAFGLPALAAGQAMVLPTGIGSAEAFGLPALIATVDLVVDAIASEEAFGTPTIVPGLETIEPTGIPSAEAFGDPVLTLLLQIISPTGIPSAEAFGTPQLLVPGADRDVFPQGIASEEAFGFPFLRGGLILMTMKTAIENALCDAAQLGTFYAITRDPDDPCNTVEGLQIQPASSEANEVSSVYAVEGRYGRDFKQDRRQWQWLLILRFHEEAITEPFEKALLDQPIVIPRDVANGIDRQLRLLLLDSRVEHPPREGASNGTEITFRFQAELCPI